MSTRGDDDADGAQKLSRDEFDLSSSTLALGEQRTHSTQRRRPCEGTCLRGKVAIMAERLTDVIDLMRYRLQRQWRCLSSEAGCETGSAMGEEREKPAGLGSLAARGERGCRRVKLTECD